MKPHSLDTIVYGLDQVVASLLDASSSIEKSSDVSTEDLVNALREITRALTTCVDQLKELSSQDSPMRDYQDVLLCENYRAKLHTYHERILSESVDQQASTHKAYMICLNQVSLLLESMRTLLTTTDALMHARQRRE